MINNKSFLSPKFTVNINNWHGTITDFSKNFVLSRNNSLEKLANTQKLDLLQIKLLEMRQLKVDKSIILCRQLSSKLDLMTEKVKNVNEILKTKENEEKLMNSKATIIQRHIRGYLTRKNLQIVTIT